MSLVGATLVVVLALCMVSQEAAANGKRAPLSANKAVSVPEASDLFVVPLGLSELLWPGAEITTVIVGDPEIAEATLAASDLVVVTGRRLGTTNLIILDAKGDVFLQTLVKVVPLGLQWPFDVRVTAGAGAEERLFFCTEDEGCTLVTSSGAPSASAPPAP